MLYKIVFYFFDLFPRLKKWFWKTWYTVFAQKVSNSDLKFMNYGYFDSELNLKLGPEDEVNRYTIQLYHHVATQINLKDLKVLEVGSGRGGGADYIARYLNPKKMTGIDISPSAIALCKKNYTSSNLVFQQGDAEQLPFLNNSFDAIINVESSHCYASMDKFLNEVKRVLKPGGSFYCLEFSTPQSILINKIYSGYKNKIIPLIGKKIAKNKRAYEYLEQSIDKFPDQEILINILEKNGFQNCCYNNLFDGIVSIHQGYKIL